MANENQEKEIKKQATKKTTTKKTTTQKKTETTKTSEKTKKAKTNNETTKNKQVKKESSKKQTSAIATVEQQNNTNHYFTSMIILMLALTIVLLVSSYAFFTYQRSGKEQNVIYTANLNIIVDDNEDLGINEQNAFPVYDEVGRQNDPYSFTLKNIGSVAANYRLMLVPDTEAIEEDGCEDNLIADESIMFQLIKDGTVIVEDTIKSVSGNRYIIDEGFIGLVEGVNKSYDYELRLWIKSTAGAEIMGRHYHGRVDVEVIDPANS